MSSETRAGRCNFRAHDARELALQLKQLTPAFRGVLPPASQPAHSKQPSVLRGREKAEEHQPEQNLLPSLKGTPLDPLMFAECLLGTVLGAH